MEEEGQEQQIQLGNEPIIYSGTGGAVNSVNGYTGDVVLTTSDLENTSDYQTGSEVESAITTAIAGKQDTLTAGNNITIQNDTISATDTTYTAGYGLGLSGTEFAVDNSTIATQDNVTNLQGQIDALAASSDVTDIVGTYADLEAYDTTHLKDNDIIKVLQDETHDGETTYYRWSTATETFTLIGEEGPYYTKAATDILLAGKQDTLTAGTNITIASDNTISATDTTYSNFTGTDGTAAGTAGLVPAPATTDTGKFLKADGTWDTAGSAVNVVQTTGTSTTDVMSQNATTKMVFADPDTKRRVRIGNENTTSGTNSIGIGSNAMWGDNISSSGNIGIGLAAGPYSSSAINGTISLGARARATRSGEMNIGTDTTTYGYNSSNYRLLSGVYDGQSAHDAATYGQVISYSAINGAGAPTTATEGKYVGQLYYDTTNEAMYFLKAIDTTTTPATYTWESLGGGGSSVNVVQTTGTSTTDVMSQNAVTSMVFADLVSKQQVQIGVGSTASGGESIAIGAFSRATSGGAISISGNNGAGTATASGYGSVLVGYSGKSTAIGAVGLGAYSNANTRGQVDIGTTDTYYGYNSSNYRLLTGVYDGQSAHDAATYGQLNTRLGGLTIVSISQTDYDNLQTVDPNTLYIITGA